MCIRDFRCFLLLCWCTGSSTKQSMKNVMANFIYCRKFLSLDFQKRLQLECNKLLKKEIWSDGHFDEIITGYRETTAPFQEIRRFPYIGLLTTIIKKRYFGDAKLQCPHIIELSQSGYIKPHIDQNCGSLIVSVSFGSERRLKLSNKVDSNEAYPVELPTGSLYALRGRLRYEFLHEIEPVTDTNHEGNRLSIVYRSEETPSLIKNPNVSFII